MDLSNFPFDTQDLVVEMVLGETNKEGFPLVIPDGYVFARTPNRHNTVLAPHLPEYEFGANYCVFTDTLALDEYIPSSQFDIVVPLRRNPSYYLANHYFFVLIVFVMGYVRLICLLLPLNFASLRRPFFNSQLKSTQPLAHLLAPSPLRPYTA